jgi:hypothetical protein
MRKSQRWMESLCMYIVIYKIIIIIFIIIKDYLKKTYIIKKVK